ncbi:MAG: HAD family acid phosphatase [Thermoanaerobaculia bacterium]
MSCRAAVAVISIALAAGGCRTAAPPPPSHLETDWVAASAEYRAILIQTYRLAGERLEELVSDRQPGTWAVALDADETLISNLRYQEEIAAAGQSYSSASFGAWVERRAAPPLPGVLAFLERVRELGGKIAVVTNRRLAWCEDTEANLEAIGIAYDVILCRGEDREKERRWQRIENGTASPRLPALEIVMFLGDNIKDFPGLDQSLAAADEADFTDFGAEFFVIPNPMYGSWAE